MKPEIFAVARDGDKTLVALPDGVYQLLDGKLYPIHGDETPHHSPVLTGFALIGLWCFIVGVVAGRWIWP